MDAKELLLQRQSNPRLIAPAPVASDLEFILNAGMRVPDHGCLSPWFFTVIKEQGLDKLSQIFEQAATAQQFTEAKIQKAKNMPYRAPLIIVVSTQYQAHDKVPKSEQAIAAGCCAHAMQMAAFSLGYGAVWRTGDFSYDPAVKRDLAIDQNNDIVGFIYIGTAENQRPIKPAKTIASHVSYL
ncbi:NAD(P)H nitroreductase [Colwellia hornerae]|uniref:Putative NAD(P)H nitroreductase n=1 Tax=Colwellia hornerae TaxID=89402 RepID=A0A5C6Q6R4_9GAMM|nr:NAD(P)H nitroreductase [Colwellia hornerae]TWX51602.1 NAD(P)H nitroreductase [Colwellia hornerae]TWX57080.1 NAD(P)H nitroreductase [Colwellia hornerae]TWX64267.1 NAD(P)H nitroreductase [Colwellia hornerae]